jgi:hypothetical protein
VESRAAFLQRAIDLLGGLTEFFSLRLRPSDAALAIDLTHANLRVLHDTMTAMPNFLDGVRSVLLEQRSSKQEAESYYGE